MVDEINDLLLGLGDPTVKPKPPPTKNAYMNDIFTPGPYMNVAQFPQRGAAAGLGSNGTKPPLPPRTSTVSSTGSNEEQRL